MTSWENLQRFIRGCVVDPELEAKLHDVADQTEETVRKANATLDEAQAALRKSGDVRDLIALAGLGLLVAGFFAGSMSQNQESQNDNT